MKIAVPHKG